MTLRDRPGSASIPANMYGSLPCGALAARTADRRYAGSRCAGRLSSRLAWRGRILPRPGRGLL
eukprot:11914365-Alexandrium_andersonii.AAC.1